MDYNSQLRDFLQSQAQIFKKAHRKLDWKYNSYYELLLDYGTVMEAKPLPKSIGRGLPKSCYFNCQRIIQKSKKYIYVEGYALPDSGIIPLAHAWLMNDKNKAVDPTWETPGLAYLGVPLLTKWVQSVLAAREERGNDNDLSMFECNYLEGFSLLKEGLPTDAYLNQEEKMLNQ